MKNRQVAVILESTSPYQRKTLVGVGAYACENPNWRLYFEEQPLAKLPDLKNWRGDGVILSFTNRHVVEAVVRMGLPTVGIEGGASWYRLAPQIPYFATDNQAIGRLGAEHLMEQGFTRLAYCGYPSTSKSPWSSERAKAFSERARRAGYPCSIYTGHHVTARRWIDLQGELTAWLKSLEKPVGLMAANDVRARHVLEACRVAGMRVPEDVAILGVDNDQVTCELTNPPLSSIEQGARSVGYQAAALLDRLMAGKRVQRKCHCVPPEKVVVRHSTNALIIKDPEVAAAVDYISLHACDPASVSDVVAAVGLSRSTLKVRFKATMGRTMREEIRKVQIAQARKLIATTDLPLKQVAVMAGFSHVYHMTDIFHKHTGWTPAEYRKHAQS